MHPSKIEKVPVVELIRGMLAGEEQALSRLISLVERDSLQVPQIIQAVSPHLGEAFCLGITGPPGAGKSTLVDRLTSLLRGRNFSVGIIAVDPSSPFSGGSVLGDRIRMQQHYLDKGVFIRSMSTRDSMGGVPRSIGGVIKLLDAFGKDFILVETVGVGQTETDIMTNADTVLVVLTPEAGDSIQTMKAGLLEIADILVVNKADREGAENLANDLTNTLSIALPEKKWQVPVLPVQALHNLGIDKLFREIEEHRNFMVETGLLAQRRRERKKKEFVETIKEKLVSRLLKLIEKDGLLLSHLKKVEEGQIDPYSASQEVLASPQLRKAWLSALENEKSDEK